MSSNAGPGARPVALTVAGVTAAGHDGNGPDGTVDGDPGTRWSAQGDGQWIQWDLGGVHDVARVGLAFYRGDGRVNTFDLAVSTDGAGFVRVLDRQRSSGTTTDFETFDLPPGTAARHVRYIGHGSDVGSWNSLTGVELWGSSPDGTGDPHPLVAGAARVTPYPTPPTLEKSPLFRVFAGSPEQEIWTERWKENRTIHLAGFAAAAGAVPIRVQVAKPFTSVDISPASRELDHAVTGSSVSFTISRPEKLILFFENDGTEFDPLYLLVDPVEDADAPTRSTGDITYFGPGEHTMGTRELRSNETLYLAAGALVTGRVIARGASNIAIRGRGILQESATGGAHTIRMDDCVDVRVEGITIRDLKEGWTSRYVGCDGVTIRGVKIFSCGVREDGIDPDGGRDVLIEDCLISTGDDCIAIKTTGGGALTGVTVRRTVLDSYPRGGGGDGVKIGTETFGDISHVLVEDCDIVRAYGENSFGGHSAFSIVHRPDGDISDVVYRNIRVERRVQHKSFEIRMLQRREGSTISTSAKGSVSDVTLENVTWAVAKEINLLGRGISGVRFHRCTMAGDPLTSTFHVERVGDPTGVTFS